VNYSMPNFTLIGQEVKIWQHKNCTLYEFGGYAQSLLAYLDPSSGSYETFRVDRQQASARVISSGR